MVEQEGLSAVLADCLPVLESLEFLPGLLHLFVGIPSALILHLG